MLAAFFYLIMTSFGWLNTTTTAEAAAAATAATATMIVALATSSQVNTEIINALMMESLRSNLVKACDSEQITLHCPKNTQILLENIFYGRLVPGDQLCPSSSTENQIQTNEEETCDVKDAHTKILEQCRNKKKCKIMVKPSFFGTDPCPNISKHLQISYKCKPVSFDEESFCEGSTMELNCKQNKRLVIYSAYYGQTVEKRMVHCAPNTPISQDCVIDVLGYIVHQCHAQTECKIVVDDEHFENPGCKPGIRKDLSLISMCMNNEIFSEAALNGNLKTMEKIISDLSSRKLQKAETKFVDDDERMFHIKDDPNFGYKDVQKSSFSNTDKNADEIINSLLPNSYEESEEENAFVTRTPVDTTSISTYHFNALDLIYDIVLIVRRIKDNKEKALLCFLLSLLGGLTMLLIACAISGCCRHKMKRKNSKEKNSEEILGSAIPTELSTLVRNNHSASVFLDSNSRICFDVGDLPNNKESFLRFTQLTASRVPQNIHGYS